MKRICLGITAASHHMNPRAANGTSAPTLQKQNFQRSKGEGKQVAKKYFQGSRERTAVSWMELG